MAPVAFASTPVRRRRAAANRGPGSLPLELVLLVRKPLNLQDRLAFTSCCRGIWMRQDVAGSPELWGKLELGSGRLRTSKKAAALAAWLARHRPALRHLSISSYTDHAQLAKALHGLAASPSTAAPAARGPAGARLPLHTLDLSSHLDREGCRDVLEPLRSLTGLRRLALRECRLAIVPPQLSVLRQLEELDFSGNTVRDPMFDDICGPLAHLASLTRLQLSRCEMCALPPQLRSLTQLRALDLSGNLLLGEAMHIKWAPLEGLPSLKSLVLRKCGLEVVPYVVATLTSLEELVLDGNTLGWDGDEAGQQPEWDPLKRLSCLTHLSLRECRLQSLPPQLTALRSLASLDASNNNRLGGGGDSAFAPLEALGALSHLDLSYCRLQGLPPQLSALTSLAALHMRGSQVWGVGEATAFEPLRELQALTVLRTGHRRGEHSPALVEAFGSILQL